MGPRPQSTMGMRSPMAGRILGGARLRHECLFHRRSYEGYDGCAPYDGRLEWPGLLRQLDEETPAWRGDGGGGLAKAFAGRA